MNTTITGLGSSGIGNLGGSIAGRVSENNVRSGFQNSVGEWQGGSSNSAAQSESGAKDNTPQEAAKPASKPLAQETVQAAQKWRNFYKRSGTTMGNADYSYLAYQALRERSFFRGAQMSAQNAVKGKGEQSANWQQGLSA